VTRIESVDIFRVIAIVAVIVIHTTPFEVDIITANPTYNYLDLIFSHLSRFAVPFFFVISGYFWGAKVRNESNPVPSSLFMSKRILIIFFAWCFIYLLPLNYTSIYEYGVFGTIYEHGLLGTTKLFYWKLIKVIQEPVILLMQGTKVHLWFLVGMLWALFITTVFVHKKQIKLLVIFSIALYLFGVLAKSYINTPLGINVEFNTRNGPFFSTLLFVTGYFLSGKAITTKWLTYGFIVFCVGTALHSIEIYILWAVFETPTHQDFVFGTYFMGVGVAMAALSNHPSLKSKFFSKIGQMTLGIYAVHLLFVNLLWPIDKATDSILWEIGYVIAVLSLSIITTHILSKNKILNKIVV